MIQKILVKNYKIFCLLVLLLHLSCSKKLYVDNATKTDIKKNDNSFRHTCIITAIDLTEDASAFSSQNDEVVFLVYADSMGQVVPDLIFQEYFTFDHINPEKTVELGSFRSSTSMLTFVLIELDTQKNVSQIEPVVRLNINKLRIAEENRDLRAIIHLLGDDDLIGIKQFHLRQHNKRGKVIHFEGIHLFDSFKYKILFM